MLQVYDELLETACRLGREHGPQVALAVLVVLAGGIGLRMLSRLLSRNSLQPPS